MNYNREFIIGVVQHRVLGNILTAYIIEDNRSGTFYEVSKPVTLRNVEAMDYRLTAPQEKLLTLLSKISDETLALRFGTKNSVKTFFEKLNQEFLDQKVSPYIDQVVAECLKLIRTHGIRLFKKQSNYSHLYDEDEIRVANCITEPVFNFQLKEHSLRYWLTINNGDEHLNLFYKKADIISQQPCAFVLSNTLYCFEHFSAKKLTPFFQKRYVSIPERMTQQYMNTFVLNTIKQYRTNADGFEIIDSVPEFFPKIIIESEGDDHISLELKYCYGRSEVSPSSELIHDCYLDIHKPGEYRFYRFSRDHQWEHSVIEKLNSLGANVDDDEIILSQKHKNSSHLDLLDWISQWSDQLKSDRFIIEQKDLEEVYHTGSRQLSMQVSYEDDWFDLKMMVQFGKFKFPFILLKKHILQGIRNYSLPDGSIAILPKAWFSEYREILMHSDEHAEHLRLSKHHFGLLEDKEANYSKDTVSRLKRLDKNNYKLLETPKGLQADLRNYQQSGYSWMSFLTKNNFGACLADDMGLGKTVQTLSVLLSDKLEQNSSNPASLIVMPSSLIHNWKNEIKKFTPELEAYAYVGLTRKRNTSVEELVEKYDVLLTTYGTLRNDVELLQAVKFRFIILDESQYIKNSGSKTYKAIEELKSKYRLTLTGTPIENSLSDLWSQFNFTNPGLLGNFSYFKREFITPIEKKNDEHQKKVLQQMINPFILRRTKEQVAKDLPPLTEQTRFCEMTSDQERIYEEERSAIRKRILEHADKVGAEKTAFLALQGLSRLRQLANHPRMLEDDRSLSSGKFNDVMRILSNLMEEKHKVLIFSSFVKHLELLQESIEENGWRFSKLTGASTHREKIIDGFTGDKDNRIFLISLKAGGVGLNLTQADYIFILDPWWNPAAELQAINRAHRIGQEKKVFVYRFLTENTIEDKIERLKARKSELSSDFIANNDPLDALSSDEMLKLFS